MAAIARFGPGVRILEVATPFGTWQVHDGFPTWQREQQHAGFRQPQVHVEAARHHLPVDAGTALPFGFQRSDPLMRGLQRVGGAGRYECGEQQRS